MVASPAAKRQKLQDRVDSDLVSVASDSEDAELVSSSFAPLQAACITQVQADELLARRLAEKYSSTSNTQARRPAHTCDEGGQSRPSDASHLFEAGASMAGRLEKEASSPASRRKQQEHADSALAQRLAQEEDFTDSKLRDSRFQHQERGDSEMAQRLAHAEDVVDRKLRDSRRKQQEHADSEMARRVAQKDELKDRKLREAAHAAKRGSITCLTELTVCQQAALNHVRQKAAALHDAAMEPLRKRVLKLGYSEDNLTKVLDYIKTAAPVIIHVKEETLPLLIVDGLYRNRFETKTSGGCKDIRRRTQWEDTLFGSQYSGAQPQDRVKYGCLNMTGDIGGVKLAHQYGKLFMILKPDVLLRATFTDKDSSKSDGQDVADAEHYAHVLLRYSDKELGIVLSLTSSEKALIRGCAGAKHFSQYKEAQIHGPIRISKDIIGLSVPGKAEAASVSLRAHVSSFQNLSGCNIIWQGDVFGD
eukprot:TRINITY_DN32787_c0_g1_i1.p1 TRINITY_DN32787_c0_g1~~TRINITY_DN32787_c0_g1_i1.p1  ORF type:complete len:476 (-),score=42.90 TRINITY_DN32787_c0_g1_i1:380-1807(-)